MFMFNKFAIIVKISVLDLGIWRKKLFSCILPQTITQSTVYECSPITVGLHCKGSLHSYDSITCRERNTKHEEEVPRHLSKYDRTTSLESGFVWQCKADYIRMLHMQWKYQLSSSVTFNIFIISQFHFSLTLPAVSAIFISLWCRVQIRDRTRAKLKTRKFCFVKLSTLHHTQIPVMYVC